MWTLLSVLIQQAPSPSSDLPSAIVAYGIAAPLVLFLLVSLRSAQKQAEEARQEAKAASDRVIEVVERSAPLLQEATEALRKSTEVTERVIRRWDREMDR